MAHTLADLSPEAHAFLAEYHLGTLTTLRADGSPHATPVSRPSGSVRSQIRPTAW